MSFEDALRDYVREGRYAVFAPGSGLVPYRGWLLEDGSYIDICEDDHHGIENFMTIEEAVWHYAISVHFSGGLLWLRCRELTLLSAQRRFFQTIIDRCFVDELIIHSYMSKDELEAIEIYDSAEIGLFLTDQIAWQIMQNERMEIE